MGARIRVALAAAAAAVVLLTAACGGGQSDADTIEAAGDAAAATSDDQTTSSSAGSPADSDIAALVTVARSGDDLAVYSAPDATVDRTLPATTGFGSPRALLVLDDQGEWLQVALPVRPNGSTAWVRRADVELRTVEHDIVVDLADRTLSLFDRGEQVLTTPVAIGTAEAPTPTGHFYVVDKLATGDAGGTYGPFALGLSAYSDVLTEFAGGDGQVGIHGTNQPSSIGQAVSHGCIRVPNDVVEVLNQVVQLGTPVTIR